MRAAALVASSPRSFLLTAAMASLAADLPPAKRLRPHESAYLKPIRDARIVSEKVDGPTIGTHDGKFHCDEALACAMLKLLPQWEKAAVVRTRDPASLDACDIVVDVGATYDPAANRFDHHQKTFTTTMDGYGTKLSSAGLVYKHFGREMLAAVTADQPLPEHVADMVYHKVYKNFIEHIDGIDNGIAVTDGRVNYHISTHLSSRVSRLFPNWNEDQSNDVVNDCFREAMVMTGSELVQYIKELQLSWWPARALVEQAVNSAHKVDASQQVMVLQQVCPWQAHLFSIEEALGKQGKLKYVLYQDNRSMWRIHAVPVAEGSFATRLGLPEPWRGLRDDELSAACGIAGATFVHASGFIGGHSTKDGALAMAQKALEFAS